jgi:hypothetical protein
MWGAGGIWRWDFFSFGAVYTHRRDGQGGLMWWWELESKSGNRPCEIGLFVRESFQRMGKKTVPTPATKSRNKTRAEIGFPSVKDKELGSFIQCPLEDMFLPVLGLGSLWCSQLHHHGVLRRAAETEGTGRKKALKGKGTDATRIEKQSCGPYSKCLFYMQERVASWTGGTLQERSRHWQVRCWWGRQPKIKIS